MQKIRISNDKVASNVTFIIEAIRRSAEAKEERQKSFSIDFDRQTGLLKWPSTSPHQNRCKPLDLHIDLEGPSVYVTEREGREDLFSLEGIERAAYRVLVETCQILKHAISKLHDVKELAHVELELTLINAHDRNLIHEAWHLIDRTEAEEVLLKAPEGSYLFRKDRFAATLEQIVATARKERVTCFTLTFIDREGQVHDKTILSIDKRWMFYDDDPTLSGDYFFSLSELLASLGPSLKSPVLTLKVG